MSTRLVPSGLLPATLQRHKAVSLAGLGLVTALAWGYIVHLAGTTGSMNTAMVMPQTYQWGLGETFGLFVMWAVMMTAMMVPSAAPVILLFAGIADRRKTQGVRTASPALFVVGYLLAWTGYSALAAIVQSVLHAAALLSPMMISASPWLGGTLLVAAGMYQWLPLKQRCLQHCRSPIGFFATEWREGARGAVMMGFRHGSFCVGCCWLLMALLFVAGVMNLVWVAGLTLIVLTEKLAPAAGIFSRATGIALIAVGGWLLLAVH
jgi:predicted metal-binding membrane protein